MSNYVMVAAGQCGNQLCYELMNQLEQHLKPDMYVDNKIDSSQNVSTNNKKKSPSRSTSTQSSQTTTEPSDDQQLLYEAFFRHTSSSQNGSKSFSRLVALDTEPKVIDDCVIRRKQAVTNATDNNQEDSNRGNAPRRTAKNSKNANTSGNSESFFPPWRYDTKSIAFRHGGAGNNWSLGYSLAQGDFLDTILDCIRRQLELADISPHLVFCHSLAGGTGSGLGTRVTECAVDEFPECLTTNIVVAPYHFGEVVVQHYNALLCLSKIQACSQSVVLLENEMAQVLCKQMRGIERPLLSDLNCVLANHIVPLFLPKIASHSPYATIHHHFSDDVLFLASHPAYRFLNIKLTPQTSKQSVEFTFDQWPALFKTIQRMQLSGAYSERNIASHIKRLGLPGYLSHTIAEEDETSTSSVTPTSPASARKPSTHHVTRTQEEDFHLPSSSPDHHHQHHRPSGGMIRSVASVLSCHGESASSYLSDAFLSQVSQQQQQRDRLPLEVLLYNSSSNSNNSNSNHNYRFASRSGQIEDDGRANATIFSSPVHSRSSQQQRLHNHHHHNHNQYHHQRPTVSSQSSLGTHSSSTQQGTENPQQPLFDEYIAAHHPLMAASGIDESIRCNHSQFLLHSYQRSAHVVANDQSMLPILRRATMKSEKMFRTGAYLHQYAMYGVETSDFIQAFYDIGSVIQNYEQL